MSEDVTMLIAESSARAAGLPELVDILAERMPVGRLQSLLLSVFERRSRAESPGEVLRRAREQNAVRPASVDQRKMAELERVMLTAVDSAFLAVELSPLCPFGLNAALASTNQKKIFTAVRGTEVMSDLTTALALEAAFQRTTDRPVGALQLCSSHRLARAQKYPPELNFSQHFKMFGLVTADNRDFNAGDAMIQHILQYLTFFAAANRAGWHVGELTVTLSDLEITERLLESHGMDRTEVGRRTLIAEGRLFVEDPPFPALVEDTGEIGTAVRDHYGIGPQLDRLGRVGAAVRAQLAADFGDVRMRFAVDRIGGLGHYDGLCFKIDGVNAFGFSYPLVDGGDTVWLSKLLSNHRERCFVSGIGTELFCRFYGAVA